MFVGPSKSNGKYDFLTGRNLEKHQAHTGDPPADGKLGKEGQDEEKKRHMLPICRSINCRMQSTTMGLATVVDVDGYREGAIKADPIARASHCSSRSQQGVTMGAIIQGLRSSGASTCVLQIDKKYDDDRFYG